MAPAPPFDFLAPLTARDRSWWRVAAMVAMGPAVGLAFSLLLIGALVVLGDGTLGGRGPRLQQSGIFLIQVAVSLVALALGVLYAAKLIFRRPIASWITAAPRFRWPLLVWAAGFTCFGVGVLMAADALMGEHPELPVLDPSASLELRLVYVAAVLCAFLAAAWAEEAVFRGYLLQQVAAFARRPWITIAVSSLAFALFHLEFDPAALAARALAGAAFAWAALRLGGLEFAIGAHLATNVIIALVQAPMLPNDAPFTGGLEDVTLQVILAAYVVLGVEIARRDTRLTEAAISSPA